MTSATRSSLEGDKEPFLNLTDHLEYIWTARRLNPHQARWALFFTRFNFTLSYRPGSKNIKADALFRLHDSGEVPILSAPIIPPSWIVAHVLWNVDVDICQALQWEHAPATCPPERTYIPTGVRNWLLSWAHTTLASGHPDITRTIQSLFTKYWWPTFTWEVTRYAPATPAPYVLKPNLPGTLQKVNSFPFPCLSGLGPICP